MLVLLLVAPVAALAIDVDRSAADQCPTAIDVREQQTVVERVTVRFLSVDDGLAAIVEAQSDGRSLGVRRVESKDPSCRELARAVTLIVSLLMKETARPTSAPIADVVSVAPAVVERRIVQDAASKPRPRLTLRAGGEAAAYGLSSATGGGLVAAGVRLGRFSVEAELHILAPSTFTVGAGRISTFVAFALGLGCAHYYVTVCAAAGGGFAQHTSSGFEETQRLVSPLGLLGGRVAYAFFVHPGVALAPRVDVFAQPSRARFFRDGAAVWTSPPLFVGAGVDVVIDP